MTYWIRQFFTRPKTHGLALAEVIVTAVIALAPLLITAIAYNYRNEANFDFYAGVKGAIGNGQLFLYAYGLIGTIFWLAFFKWNSPMHGPRRLLGFVTLLASLVIVGMLGLDPTISNAKNKAIVLSSYWTYGAFLFINYLLLFYLEIEPPPPDESLKSGSRKLKLAYRKMEEGQHG
ncbi:hypothetical protein [Lysobacter sp. Root494]|uniref:hypothetical protein n=1 Tax=Lysobacter sp. Root494 TaxID=1736549 RepID=UPI0006F68ECA|nr:hypothetical protein [Lysobacter sp. Root494]KQY50500.1 hypothetical protein ASD14_12385 [Lysobacter sp. Root494]